MNKSDLINAAVYKRKYKAALFALRAFVFDINILVGLGSRIYALYKNSLIEYGFFFKKIIVILHFLYLFSYLVLSFARACWMIRLP